MPEIATPPRAIIELRPARGVSDRTRARRYVRSRRRTHRAARLDDRLRFRRRAGTFRAHTAKMGVEKKLRETGRCRRGYGARRAVRVYVLMRARDFRRHVRSRPQRASLRGRSGAFDRAARQSIVRADQQSAISRASADRGRASMRDDSRRDRRTNRGVRLGRFRRERWRDRIYCRPASANLHSAIPAPHSRSSSARIRS